MSVLKMVKIGRPKLPFGRRKITWQLTIEPELLAAIRAKSKHGKIAAWVRAALWEAINK
jgi:hypothetical protein